MTFGDKLQRLRKANGLSQEQLAAQLTVSRQAISKWELGESTPDTENIVQLSQIFRVSTDYLLFDEYESDNDLPVVKVESDEIKREYNIKALKASYFLIAFGLIGVLVLWVLSSVIPARMLVPDPSAHEIQIRDGVEMELSQEEMGDTIFYKSAEVRGNLTAFLETYYLSGLFMLCCAMVLVGVLILFISHKAIRKRQ